jgi:hypothetical protein
VTGVPARLHLLPLYRSIRAQGALNTLHFTWTTMEWRWVGDNDPPLSIQCRQQVNVRGTDDNDYAYPTKARVNTRPVGYQPTVHHATTLALAANYSTSHTKPQTRDTRPLRHPHSHTTAYRRGTTAVGVWKIARITLIVALPALCTALSAASATWRRFVQ